MSNQAISLVINLMRLRLDPNGYAISLRFRSSNSKAYNFPQWVIGCHGKRSPTWLPSLVSWNNVSCLLKLEIISYISKTDLKIIIYPNMTLNF